LLKNNKKHILNTINLRRKIICYKFMFLETLARKIKPLYRSLIDYRKKIVLKEIEMAGISSDDQVLFIGCGILPSTPIIIAEETKAKVVTIDNSMNACKIARSQILQLGLSEMIDVRYGDGAFYPVDTFDVIILATNVWPIEQILKNLSQHVRDDVRMICRDIKNDIEEILRQEKLYDSFSIKSYSEHPAGMDYKSLLLTKKQKR